MEDQPFTVISGGVLLTVRLTPKGGRDAVDGVEQLSDGRPVLKARVRAVPEDGAANKALFKVLAEWLKIPASKIELRSGHTARLKTVFIAGDGASLTASLSTALANLR